MQISHCRICGSPNLDMVLDLGIQPWGNDFVADGGNRPEYPLELYFCKDCSLVQIGYTVPKEVMFNSHLYMSGTTRTLAAHFAEVAAGIVFDKSLGEKDLVVDIGGNDGTGLLRYAAAGCRVLNVEPGWKQAETAIQAGIPCANRFFNAKAAKSIRDSHGPASVINAAGVLFHLEELHDVMDGIKILLADDGTLVVQCVYLGSIVEKGAFDNIYHEHLLYYTLTTLTSLLEMHGLAPVSVRRSPIHGGSIIVQAQHAGVTPPHKGVLAVLEEEKSNGLLKIETYRGFAKRVACIKNVLLEILEKYRTDGKTVFAYGAPVKGSTLLNYCGISPRLVLCAIEKNPLKVGTYYPGAGIYVRDEATAARPDAYLVLAWNFLDEFIEKEREFLDGGGEFIVPFSYPHVIRKEGVA